MTYYDFLILYYAFTKMVPPHIQDKQLLHQLLNLWGLKTYVDFLILYYAFTGMVPPHIQENQLLDQLLDRWKTYDLPGLPNTLLSVY